MLNEYVLHCLNGKATVCIYIIVVKSEVYITSNEFLGEGRRMLDDRENSQYPFTFLNVKISATSGMSWRHRVLIIGDLLKPPPIEEK